MLDERRGVLDFKRAGFAKGRPRDAALFVRKGIQPQLRANSLIGHRVRSCNAADECLQQTFAIGSRLAIAQMSDRKTDPGIYYFLFLCFGRLRNFKGISQLYAHRTGFSLVLESGAKTVNNGPAQRRSSHRASGKAANIAINTGTLLSSYPIYRENLTAMTGSIHIRLPANPAQNWFLNGSEPIIAPQSQHMCVPPSHIS